MESRFYRKNDFIRIIKKKGFFELYNAYLRVKNDRRLKNDSEVEDARKLLFYIKSVVKHIENGKKRKKT